MSWYLSEVVCDLGQIEAVLYLYDQLEDKPQDQLESYYKSKLADYLRKTPINTEHIEWDTIPDQYQSDEYKWLASDYHELLLKLRFIRKTGGEEEYREEQEINYSYQPTEIGLDLINGKTTIDDILAEMLPEWRNDQGITPYPEIKELLHDIKTVDLYPCPGLLLIEVLLVLMRVNQKHGNINLFEFIHAKRREFYQSMLGDRRVDLIHYSDFLWEQLSHDLYNYHASNYPARSSIMLMMQAGELIYGPVPKGLFGLIQYIMLAE